MYGFRKRWNLSVIPFWNHLDQHNSFLMKNKYVPNTLKIIKNDFISEGANFQGGLVGGKMNSEAVGQKVKVVS